MSIENPNNGTSEEGVEKIPTGREIGEQISREDLISVGALSGTIALILEPEKVTDAGDFPAYTWLQEIDATGKIIAEPHMGPPVRMKAFSAGELFDASDEEVKE